MRQGFFKNEFVEQWLEDGVVFSIYTKKPLNIVAAKEIVQERYKLVKGKSHPTLVDYTAGMSADKESRDYLAGENGIKYVSAGAIVIKNHIQKLLGNAFLTINRPKVPARLFTSRDEALKWLQFYKNVN